MRKGQGIDTMTMIVFTVVLLAILIAVVSYIYREKIVTAIASIFGAAP